MVSKSGGQTGSLGLSSGGSKEFDDQRKVLGLDFDQSWEPKDRFGSRFGSFENLGSGSGFGF